MKKHIFAFICVFVLMFNIFTYTETKAMDIGVAIDVGSEILYEGWDMIQSIFNGFVISLGQYAGYADKASAMAAFYNDWGDVLTVLTGGYLSPAETEQSAISVNTVYPMDFGMSGAVMRDFIYNYGGFISDPNLGMYAPVNMRALASWNRYNDLYAQRFIDAFNKDIETHPTNPDFAFVSYIDYINNDPYLGLHNINFQASINNTPYSYYGLYKTIYTVNDFYTPVTGNGIFIDNVFEDIVNIDITSSGNIYSFSIPSNTYTVLRNNFWFNPQGWYVDKGLYTKNVNNYITGRGLQGGYGSPYKSNFNGLSYSGSLDQVFAYIRSHFKNVNITVDGVLWAYIGESQTPIVDLSPDIPRYDENGNMIGKDVFFPEQDLKADLVKFTELIDDKILSGDNIDLDDLIDAGVLTDGEGNIITDDNRDEYITKKDISAVISDVLEDNPTLTDFTPNAPDPPPDDPWNWHFPTIVIPEGGDPEPRKTGLSVLARIINVTNQSLPGEVITMFWGICITMLILGIIKILHK